MNLFRKDGPKKPDEIEQATVEEVEEVEELTDINEIADVSSSPKKPKMEEIYSTKDKHVKYKRMTPIEAEEAAKRMQLTKEELVNGKVELDVDEHEPAPEVELEPELDESTTIADEVIEDVADVRTLRHIYVQDIDDIDISLDPSRSVREYERRANDTERRDARLSKPEQGVPYSADKIVARVPVYRHDSKVEMIFLKAGRFTEVVESEYNEYLKSADPTISKNYHTMLDEVRPKQSLLYTLSQIASKHKEKDEHTDPDLSEEDRESAEEAAPKKRRSKVGKFFRVLKAVIGESVRRNPSPPSSPEETPDYSSREDEQYVLAETKQNIRRCALGILWYVIIAGLLLTLMIMERGSGGEIFGSFSAHGPLLYVLANFILLIVLGIVGRGAIGRGMAPLKRFRGNVDTALGLAYFGCLIQGAVALFDADDFVSSEHHLYGFVVAFGFILAALGRLFGQLRVKRNFRFITSKSPAYAAKIYNDEEVARRMISGTSANRGVVAYQHITSFLSDFLKISYAPDPSEEVMSKLVPVTVVSSVFVAVIYAILFKSVAGTVSALAVMLCISIPFTAMLGGNLPLYLFSGRALRHNAMVAGYPSVRQFCDTNAVMASSSELFPKGTVKLVTMDTYQEFRVQEGLLLAAAVMKEADSPLHHIFDDLLDENIGNLPVVESVMYEDKSGLVGWIGGDRILIGNAALMRRYHITLEDQAAADRNLESGRQVSYIAVSGRLLAMVVTTYRANPYVREQLRRGENAGLSYVVSTTDANITAELIAEEYGLFYRSVKVVPTGYATVIDEQTGKVEETSRAYVATRGRLPSLVRAIAGCISLRMNINVGLVIQLFGLVLGVLLCATMALFATVARLSVVELMIYILFWAAATVIAELIRQP